MSTAAMAAEQMPGRPRLRIRLTMASHAAGTAIASMPTTTSLRVDSISRAAATSA
jgi:hypothetical protein